jgi:SAM-dependent methyltransferase
VDGLGRHHDDELMSSGKYWSEQLAAWAIPSEILAQAPTSPWIHPLELFEVAANAKQRTSLSTELALAALPDGGSVLDIGCGGGRGAIALAHKAHLLIGVDHQQGMLTKFAEAAEERNVDHFEIFGDWPANAADVPIADVAIAHHVIYNVSDLEGFAEAMNSHAKIRVLLEAPDRHPLSNLDDLWLHFWNLTRPKGPTAQDAFEAICEAGYEAHIKYFDDDPRPSGQSLSMEKQVEFTRVRLCLPVSKDAELRTILMNRIEQPRRLAAIWWDPK